ncbi:MAG: glycosyltransferase [Desulfobacteraceae bacterium]|nr:glycosyltransferase [Desulfobacteraceae bacterium]
MSENFVAFFVPSMRRGGAERVMLNLAIGLRERGLRVDMVLAKAEGPYLCEIPPEIKVVDLGASRISTSLAALIRYLRQARPAGLISTMDHTNIAAILAKRLAHVDTKIVATVHNTTSVKLSSDSELKPGRRLKIKVVLLLVRMLYPRAHAVVAVSEGVANDIAKLASICRSRIEVIYNPVITRDLKSKSKSNVKHKWLAEKDRPVLIAVGELSTQKNFWNLLRAFKRVLEQRPARLIILGEGKERNSLESLIVELGIAGEVDMPGFVDNPYNYMANSDVFVLSSDWEGLPTVLIEALGVGTPVVSTDCPSGPREVLQGGRIGRLVPVGNWEMLAEAIISTLDEPRKAVDPEALKPFTKDAAVDAYLNLLRKQGRQR